MRGLFFCHQSDHAFLINRKMLILTTIKKTRKKKVVCDWQLAPLGVGCRDLLHKYAKHERTKLADPTWHRFFHILLLLPHRIPTVRLLSVSLERRQKPHNNLLRVFFFPPPEIYFGFVVVILNITDVPAFFHIIPLWVSCYP